MLWCPSTLDPVFCGPNSAPARPAVPGKISDEGGKSAGEHREEDQRTTVGPQERAFEGQQRKRGTCHHV